MASNSAQPITFLVRETFDTTREGAAPGAARASRAFELNRGRVKQSVRLGVSRAAGGETRVSAIPGEDAVVLHIAGGPSLVLNPETARDLMLAQSTLKRSRSAKGKDDPAPNEVSVPTQLRWRGIEDSTVSRGGTRGFFGNVILSAIDVITDLVSDPATVVASKVVESVDAQVDAGVYQLKPESLAPLKGSAHALARVSATTPASAPLLVFVHGTFSNTSGTFSKLWTEHPARVRALFEHYQGRVYGLDHPTLGVSPIENALTLAAAMPKGARLHLVTHSRGGLVAEVLARVCAKQAIDETDLKFFRGDDHKKQHDALNTLGDLVKSRDIRVERVVRVACPARGTLLASKRLDAYVSVFKWTLELASIPVAPALVEFLGAVAVKRADWRLMPGLAAQVPDSAMVQWLHAVDDAIPGELRVVAGDVQGDSVTSWLKTLLADAFYWTDNDLVVQTRSMYGGAPRANGARFLLDAGGKVSHFNYFTNERTAEAIVNALVQDLPRDFRDIGPLSWAGKSSDGVRGARGADERKPASERPAVFLLPGILGSNLKVNNKRIWLGVRIVNGLKHLTYTPNGSDGVEPDGPIGRIYDDLAAHLSKTHEVIEYAFDWRRPIEEEARRLATAVDAALAARDKSGQPVRLLAHSMGGLVARTMQLERPDVWKRLMSHQGARLLMLGTPNGGSWAPMQVLSGDDTFGNTLMSFGAPFQDCAARQMMAAFPGLLQMQAALLDPALALAKAQTWQRLADEDLQRVRDQSWWHKVGIQLNAYVWGVPTQDVLDRAVALRQRLDAQRDKDLAAFSSKLLLVAGKSPLTPDGFALENDGLAYLDVADAGDGRVTLKSARLPHVRTWQIACEHGDLPNEKTAFDAYVELLQTGTTNLIPSMTAAAESRGAASTSLHHVRSRPSRSRTANRPTESTGDLFALEGRQPPETSAARGPALRVTVVNGDLGFVHQPLLLGHYRSTRLTGTERVMDRLIGGAMADSIKVGLYPDLPGTHQVFINARVPDENPLQSPRPEAVVVVGLGAEGKLRPTHLVRSVRQAVLAWAQRAAERTGGASAVLELAATLIGSGGKGISAGQSAQLVTQGVQEANERMDDPKWPRVGHLSLIELYLDRATEAWRALDMLATDSPGRYVIADSVVTGIGPLRRPLDSSYRGVDYDFISAVTQKGESGDVSIAYALDTKRARTEIRAQRAQTPLLRALVASASNDECHDTQVGRTLFKLLIPVEMEPFLGGSTEMLLELDNGTAGIPWELLDARDEGGDARPWAIRAKLLRKLRTVDFRSEVADADLDASVLVIGEPRCDSDVYPSLPGARDEANAVAERLRAPTALGVEKVKALIRSDDPADLGPDARTVMNAFHERDWRIVHIAGHGEPPEQIRPKSGSLGHSHSRDGDPRGVVLSGGTFLGPREIESMRVVPELVFVNCCHLAGRNVDQVLRDDEPHLGGRYDRARFASGVAEELIKIGVRCVIAAGWAVEDGPAKTFATTFYEALLLGQRFVDAVGFAREAAFAEGGNTWAAYQCYGDPDWYLSRGGVGDAQRPPAPLAEEFGGVVSALALTNALETIEVQTKFQKRLVEEQRGKIRHLEARFSPQWGSVGSVAEAFAKAWAATGNRAEAIDWYRRALHANDGTASIKAAEQFGNLRARLAWETVAKAKDAAKPKAAINAARKELEAAITLLERLASMQPTIERESLCGSAWKRMAMLEAVARRKAAESKAITCMRDRYEKAEKMAREVGDTDLFYPALQRIAAELVVNAGGRASKRLDLAAIGAVRQSLAARPRDKSDFWSFVSVTELRLYEALDRRDLASEREAISREFADLHARVSASWMWASVNDQANFVLPKYAASATATEKRAATAILAQLESFAK